MDFEFEPMYPGFESRESPHDFLIFFLCFFVIIITVQLLLQCKFASSTLLSLLSFSYFITPYDAQASSAFSALIFLRHQVSVPSTIFLFKIFLVSQSGNLK